MKGEKLIWEKVKGNNFIFGLPLTIFYVETLSEHKKSDLLAKVLLWFK